MKVVRIKICGITRVEDALCAAKAGADAIGMVFHPKSPRNISVERARQIIAALPAFVTPVGLFVDESADAVLRAASDLHLATVQLHGHESPETVADLQAAGLKVIKAIRVTDGLADEVARWKAPPTAFVLETAGTAEPGGTGVVNDFARIETASAAHVFGALPVIIAGGLTPRNVGEVVRRCRPYAVDVSTGVEDGVKGIKSASKIQAFVQAAHQAG